EGEPDFTPIPADKLTVSEGVAIVPLAKQAASNDNDKDCYVTISFGSYWDKEWGKEYTISYEDYSMTVKAELPDVGFYSAPEATTGNYIDWWLFGTAPGAENESIYFISRATDETYGRHVINVELNKDHPENKDFSLVNVIDNVYKLTRTCGINIHELRPLLDITWQEGEGGNPDPYVEQRDFFGWANSSMTVSEKEYERRTPMDELKGIVSSEITLQAGESKEVYIGMNYFDMEQGKWVANWTNAGLVETSNGALTINQDTSMEYSPKATIRCDVPGTYTINFKQYAYWYPEYETMTLYHAGGKEYTAAEKQAFDENYGWGLDEDLELLIYDDDHPDGAPFEEVFPGDTIDWTPRRDPDFFPITVTVTGEAPKPAFTDVGDASWYASAVAFANANGYMNGNPDGTFNPTGRIKGAEFTQILYNKENKPTAAEGASFQGVGTQWYAAPVLWAAGKGIVTDSGDAAMVPTEDLTRQQIALMLYNYMGQPEGRADLSGFSDADKVSAWALEAMQWAVSAGVLQGSGSALDPAGTATRAETAQILMNFFG
ncbi:MAG: S-layer homology domain-containing protein, partial [Oscillospiraceae bacterium]|nr:S-layer homology domain-containing protein [Oscillospiraceae bacterium]